VAAERSPGDVLVDAVAEARRIRGSVNVEPDDSRRWSAVVAAVDGSLEIECLHRDDPGDGEKDEWHVPRTLDGCREGSRELLRRLSPEWPDAEAVPLFIHLLTPRG
jgi:hypothetical protein